METNPKNSLKLYADKSGRTSFNYGPAKESDVIEKFVIDCDQGGRITRFPVQLRVSSNPTPEMPALPVESMRPPKGTKVRPALSEEEMTNLSDAELVKRGYLRRPDPKQTEHFDHWKQIVSRPTYIFEPEVVTDNEVRSAKPEGVQQIVSSTTTSYNWGGVVYPPGQPTDAPQIPNRWAAVYGRWVTPKVTGLTSSTDTNAKLLIWVGIDGWLTNTVFQGGTGHYVIQGANGPATDDFLWYQYNPDDLPIGLTRVSLPPGVGPDDIVNVTVRTAAIFPDGSTIEDGNGYIDFILRRGHDVWITTITRGLAGRILGNTSAEWIAERPQFSGVFSNLANFGHISINTSYASAYADPDPDPTNYYPAEVITPCLMVNMINPNTGNTLSTTDPHIGKGGTIGVTWRNSS